MRKWLRAPCFATLRLLLRTCIADDRLPTRMGAVQATEEPMVASVCQLRTCLLHCQPGLGKTIPHTDSGLRGGVFLDGPFFGYSNPGAVVAVSPLRKVVLGNLVV
jgi:hypothetical protein